MKSPYIESKSLLGACPYMEGNIMAKAITRPTRGCPFTYSIMINDRFHVVTLTFPEGCEVVKSFASRWQAADWIEWMEYRERKRMRMGTASS